MKKSGEHKVRPKPRSREHTKAATRDVLSAPPKKVKISPKWEPNYRHLKELQTYFLRLRGTLVEDANEEQPNFSEHMADAGTDSYDRDFALSMLSSDQDALYEIELAIRRIEEGTYGICEVTGKSIPRERLNAIPWTRFSLDAEKQLEQRGMLTRARLGNLGSITEVSPPTEPPDKEPPEPNAAAESD